MTTFCSKVNIPIQPLINFDVYDPSRPKILNPRYSFVESVSLAYLNPELVDYLSKRNLLISQLDIIYCDSGQSHPIHVDYPHVKSYIAGDYVRLNWIYGGSDSEMSWYELKDSAKQDNQSLIARKYNENDVNKIHSQNILGTQLVQVGIPHTVKTGVERRYAICCDISSRKISPSRVTMADALRIFQDVIV